MKEIRVEARLRNNRLYQAIYTEYASVSEFCRAHNLSQSIVGGLLNLTESPFFKERRGSKTDRKGRAVYKHAPIKVAEALKETPEYLFPPAIYKMVKVKTVVEVGLNEIPAGHEPFVLPQGEINIERQELKEGMKQALSTLTAREQAVVKGRVYEDKTLEVVGEEMHITKERVRQIEMKALRKLSNPVRKLKRFT